MKTTLRLGVLALILLVLASADAQVVTLPQLRNWSGAYVPSIGAVLVDTTGAAIGAGNPITTAGKQEALQLATGNVAFPQAAAFGGSYIFAQICSSYGSVALQVLGPDGSTWQTVLTKSAADNTGGTALSLGSGAVVRAVLSGTAGCAASLSRVPA